MSERRHTVLVVDDTPNNIHLIADLLRDRYKVKAAANAEAVDRIVHSDNPPDLILLDVMMPDVDGHEVCRRLKADPATRHIPVIFQTACTDTVDEVRGFELGAVDYITKPINPHRLLARVATHLELADARRRLEQQNEELREAASLREDVDRIMRHDLKTPLNAIMGVPQYLLSVLEMEETERNLLELVEEAGRRMLEMINLSLDLFKMERGVYELQAEAVDLTAVVRSVLSELGSLAKAKGVALSLEDAEAGLHASGETLLCHSMIANLCKNAIEAAPAGSAVQVRLTRQDGQARVSVSNAGEVPVEIRDRFFDKYVTAGKREGTGLGTYSARLIAETQGGRIALDTARPGHTTISVDLPVSQAVPQRSALQTMLAHSA